MSLLTPPKKKSALAPIPVYRRIEEDLRARVGEGEWSPGTMLPSRKDLAKEYRVNLRTMQRAVAGLLADGTLRADSGRGTFVPRRDGAERRDEPALQAVAAILTQGPNGKHPFPLAISQGINQALLQREARHRLVIFNTISGTWDQFPELERRALQAIERDNIAGAIIWHSGEASSLPDMARLTEKGVPLVFVDRYPTEFDCDFVGIDNYQSAREAVEYLIRLGHRKIGFISTVETITSVQQREAGYRDALTGAGILPAEGYLQRIRYTTDAYEQVIPATDAFLALPEPPTGYLMINDNVAYKFIAAAATCGLRVPEDVSVVSFDDIDRFSPRPPFLTTIHQPLERIGRRAGELLLDRLATPRRPGQACQQIFLPAHLVERHSCRSLS